MIVTFHKSHRKNKKYMAIFTDNGTVKVVHFGDNRYEDFTDHKDNNRKMNYLARHQNENWENFQSPGSLSRYILWNKPTLDDSIKDYRRMFFLK